MPIADKSNLVRETFELVKHAVYVRHDVLAVDLHLPTALLSAHGRSATALKKAFKTPATGQSNSTFWDHSSSCRGAEEMKAVYTCCGGRRGERHGLRWG
jgi:hypothetical protein